MHISATTYMTLCGLLRDAMLVPSDATPLLTQAAQELARMPQNDLPVELRQNEQKRSALRTLGFGGVANQEQGKKDSVRQ